MTYKGYTAAFEYEPRERVFHGRVQGIRDIVTFEAPTLPELEREFRISVDVYLECCAEDGLTPNPPPPRSS